MKRSILLLSISFFFLAGCIPSGDNASKDKYDFVVSRYEIGKHALYIPYAYTRFKMANVSDTGGIIYSYYPGSSPIVQSTTELRKSGKNINRISILFTDLKEYPKFEPLTAAQRIIASANATRTVGDQFGLLYMTQPAGSDPGAIKREVWMEESPADRTHFITCRKKSISAPTPQCAHQFFDERFLYRVSYNRRQLENWRTIQTHVQELMDSFSSGPRAEELLREKFYETYFDQMGEQP